MLGAKHLVVVFGEGLWVGAREDPNQTCMVARAPEEVKTVGQVFNLSFCLVLTDFVFVFFSLDRLKTCPTVQFSFGQVENLSYGAVFVWTG